ncbi:MAG: hypothetical protein LBH62_03965 [Nitrososphaerota archaeon]|nr:hypothetical protein [Nitrososphaerota archaeon]
MSLNISKISSVFFGSAHKYSQPFLSTIILILESKNNTALTDTLPTSFRSCKRLKILKYKRITKNTTTKKPHTATT